MISHLILNIKTALFVAALEADFFESICHVSMFLKLIHVLPVIEQLLMYN